MASILEHISSSLPPGDGLLPRWLLFISVVSIGNSIQSYISLAGTREVYAGAPPLPTRDTTSSNAADTKQTTPVATDIPQSTTRKEHASPVTALSARTFGTWTAITSIVRLYAAYHINDPAVYELGLWTFGIAFAHFVAEWLIFGTARWGKGLAGPIFVSTGTGAWMLTQWSHYVK